MSDETAMAPREEAWAEVEAKLDRLVARKEEWGAAKPSVRLRFLKRVRYDLVHKVDLKELALGSAGLQGFDSSDVSGQRFAGVEMLPLGLSPKGQLDSLIATYKAMVADGDRYDGPIGQSLKAVKDPVSGRLRVPLPRNMADRALQQHVELILEDGAKDLSNAKRAVNEFAGQSCLSLGAGNQTFLSWSDVLHKLFVDGQVTLLKHHPLRAFASKQVQVMFGSMIEAGFFEHVVCDVPTTGKLTLDPRIDTLHMTGGKPTHDLIVRNLRAEGLEKPFTSELGNVTPWIVASGGKIWSPADMEAQVNHLLFGVLGNASCNCLAPKVVVLDRDWPQHDVFLKTLKERVAASAMPPAYYPGAKSRYEAFREASEAEEGTTVEFVEPAQDPIPLMLDGEDDPRRPLPLMILTRTVDLDDPATTSAHAFANEAFSPVLAVASIAGGNNDAATFLPKATVFANEHLFGTLSCTLVADDNLVKSPAVQQALVDLRYGTVAINAWTAIGFAASDGVWGGFPGETIDNVESGIGFVHNCKLVPGVEKAVVRLPFRHRGQAPPQSYAEGPSPKVLSKTAELVLNPSIGKLMSLLGASLCG